ATGLLPAAAEEALWTLVARGLVTGDGTAGLRTLLKPDTERRPRRLRALRGGRARLVPAGRWALLRAGSDAGAEAEPMRFARQLLRRWGVVVRDLLAREARMPPWRVVLGALRTLEARGEIRGGRFVAGLVGEQFALPEAVEALRAVRRGAQEPETVVVAAADPLNLVGVLVPGALAVVEVDVVRSLSITFDEQSHIGAGFSYVTHGDVVLNPEHPPLVKLIAGATIAALGVKESAAGPLLALAREQPAEASGLSFAYGERLLFHDNPAFVVAGARPGADAIVTAARLPLVVF